MNKIIFCARISTSTLALLPYAVTTMLMGCVEGVQAENATTWSAVKLCDRASNQKGTD